MKYVICVYVSMHMNAHISPVSFTHTHMWQDGIQTRGKNIDFNRNKVDERFGRKYTRYWRAYMCVCMYFGAVLNLKYFASPHSQHVHITNYGWLSLAVSVCVSIATVGKWCSNIIWMLVQTWRDGHKVLSNCDPAGPHAMGFFFRVVWFDLAADNICGAKQFAKLYANWVKQHAQYSP